MKVLFTDNMAGSTPSRAATNTSVFFVVTCILAILSSTEALRGGSTTRELVQEDDVDAALPTGESRALFGSLLSLVVGDLVDSPLGWLFSSPDLSASPTSPPTVATTLPPSPAPTTKMPTPAPSIQPISPPVQAPVSLWVQAKMSAVQGRVRSYALQGGNEFADFQSYQSRATLRMAQRGDIFFLSDSLLAQLYSLYCLYEATNGITNFIIEADTRFDTLSAIPTWSLARGWDGTDSSLSFPCLGWTGVVCDGNGKVTELELFQNFLTGNLPKEIVLLASDGPHATGAGNLRILDLFGNEFLSNNRDNSWWEFLGSNFEELLFSQTAFAGDLGRLPANIVELDVSFSFISGGLTDATFEGCNRLEYLNLDGSFFYDQTVPSVMGRLSSLESLFLLDSAVSGDLSYMEGMPRIVEHWIDFNPQLGGSLPTFLGDLTTLASFSVTQNNLVGPLPTELGKLTNMQQMWFTGNQLTGNIPTELGLLKGMRILQVEGNQFVGSMPSQVCDNSNSDGSTFKALTTLGVDCLENTCDCCTCCSVAECN